MFSGRVSGIRRACRRAALGAVLAAVLPASIAQTAPLQLELIPFDRSLPQIDFATTESRPDMLPDGVVIRGHGLVSTAWLTGPTRRYAHGVLGDATEASGLAVETAGGKTLMLALSTDAVFEDRYPRPVDIDADGNTELMVVKTYVARGAALALAGIRGGRLSLIAESDPIGLPNRWLNPVGTADFDGDGRVETAHVETPHIGGVLVLSRLMGARLEPLHRAEGFSNHRIGSRELGLSAVFDANGDGVSDILLPDRSRTGLRLITFAGGTFRELGSIGLGAEVVSGFRPVRIGDRQAFAMTLTDGGAFALVIRP